MPKPKLIRITTVPLSLEKLLDGQLGFMSNYFEVTAISSETERLKRYAEKEGVAYYPLCLTRKITPLQDLLATYKLYRFLKKKRPNIVHTHTPKAGIVGMLAAWMARVPNRLHTVAGLPLMEEKGFKKKLLVFIEKLTYRCATRVYPNSQGLYHYILAQKMTYNDKLFLIGNGSSNGIDTDYFSPSRYDTHSRNQLKQTLNIPPSDFVFLFVGRIVKDKGIVELINAFQQMHASAKHVSLVLVGPFEETLDPLPKQTLELIHSHPKIITTGYQQDVRPYFSICDTFVFPSYREGFPNVVMQAGAMGVPCIVSNINGCNEIITHNENGLIVPAKDERSLLEAMEALSRDEAFRVSLVEKSRNAIVSRFERKEIWNALLKTYQSL